MNFHQRLKNLEERVSRRAASVHPLHRLMAAACNHPGLGDAMDALADRLYPIGVGDETDERTSDELMENFQTLLLETGVSL